MTGRRGGLFWASLGPPALWLGLFFLLPMAALWLMSLGATLRAFEGLYLAILLKSAGIAALVTLICLVAGFPVALLIAFAPDRAKPWLLLAVMLPFWTNLLIRTYALQAILRDQGLVNQALGLAGIAPLPMINTDFAVVLGLVYVHLPFMVLPLYAALDRLDRSLIEAALDLGAGQLRALATVVVPLALPGIASGILVTFVPAIGSYLTPDLLGGPDSQMIANVIERQFKRADDWAFGAALSFVLLYLTLLGLALQALIARRRGLAA